MSLTIVEEAAFADVPSVAAGLQRAHAVQLRQRGQHEEEKLGAEVLVADVHVLDAVDAQPADQVQEIERVDLRGVEGLQRRLLAVAGAQAAQVVADGLDQCVADLGRLAVRRRVLQVQVLQAAHVHTHTHNGHTSSQPHATNSQSNTQSSHACPCHSPVAFAERREHAVQRGDLVVADVKTLQGQKELQSCRCRASKV